MTFKHGWLLVALGLSVLPMARASSVDVGGGVLSMGGGSLTADTFLLNPNAELSGNGEIHSQCVLAGSVSPGTSLTDIGTLVFYGDVVFDAGTYLCYAATDTNLDQIRVTGGDVTGPATVALSRTSSHVIPLWQIILQGGEGSDYSGFVPTFPATWRLETTNSLDLMATDQRGDRNADGMPDWWEQWYFDGRTAAGVDGDPDDDHFRNLYEYLAGTDPQDILSALAIETSQLTTNGMVLQWQSVTGKSYCLMSCDEALTGTWSQVSKEIDAGSGISTVYTNTDLPPPRFHAISVISP